MSLRIITEGSVEGPFGEQTVEERIYQDSVLVIVLVAVFFFLALIIFVFSFVVTVMVVMLVMMHDSSVALVIHRSGFIVTVLVFVVVGTILQTVVMVMLVVMMLNMTLVIPGVHPAAPLLLLSTLWTIRKNLAQAGVFS